MARVLYGALITNLRGSVGGTTFQNNKYGYTAKNKQLQIYSGTEFQLYRRRVLTQIAQAWNSLTDTNRAAWVSFATNYPYPVKFNTSLFLNAYNYFLKYNFEYYLDFNTFLVEPIPGTVTLPSFAPSLVRSGTNFVFDLNESALPSDMFYNMYISSPQKNTRSFKRNSTRYLFTGTVDGLAVNINTLYQQRFGFLPSAGNVCNLSLFVFNRYTPVLFGNQNFMTVIT